MESGEIVIQVKKNARQNTVQENTHAIDFGSRFCAWFEFRHLMGITASCWGGRGKLSRCTHVQAVIPIRMHGQQQVMMLSRMAPVKLVFS